ncbi:hypothetical protein PR048_005101 [Dryococelus australis]|uniref:Polyprotein n=1 Tax=Dryococelus australis TaxID=614101 RepID=A0ABQ9I7A5_9NEOP|nr:hypothetical protein PR048_005101 [Dryococelus australis]
MGSKDAVKMVKTELGRELEIKDLGEANYVSSIKLRLHIHKLLRDFSMSDCKPSKTILHTGYTATKDDEQEFDGTIYRSVGTRDLKLCFKGGRQPAGIYCDADWGGDTESRKSVSGYMVVVLRGAVLWHSKKQNCIARSTMEAEYMAMAEVSRELMWMRNLLVELGV